MTEPELSLALPARPENVLVVRQAVSGLGEAIGLSEERVNDVKTVVTEACNNVVVHAYEDGESGPMIVTAQTGTDDIEITVSDRGGGFQPRAAAAESSLGLGLPLIASLSDRFSIRGGAGEGTSISISFDLVGSRAHGNGTVEKLNQELAMNIAPGAMVRPVLARVIGALAARADFSYDRLSDTVLLGDAVSAHEPGDFSQGRVEIAIKDGDGSLKVRVGPLVEGAGDRIVEEMQIPGEAASLKALTRSMEVTPGKAPDGEAAEFLEFEVAEPG